MTVAPARDAPLPAASGVARDVDRGLRAEQKWLPSYLFYDRAGSALYEQITELPEYYPTRTERGILAAHARELVALAAQGSDARLAVVELGAGTASKTTLVLSAVVAQQGACTYVPIDVSPDALDEARARIAAVLPSVVVRPCVGRHEEAFGAIRALGPRRLVLFIGSSIGNFDDDDAVTLLRGVRLGLDPGCALLLGTDLRKSASVLLPAYDDAAGVTAAFNRNVLVRLNRELGADFDVARFRHLALWNEPRSRIEMHLVSEGAQQVTIEALGRTVAFHDGERIHTESSVKYDLKRVDALLDAAGFAREHTRTDERGYFGVHLARAR